MAAAAPVIPVPLSQNMLGKPPEFDGTEQGWQGYKFVIESYIGALDIDMYDELRISETSAAEINLVDLNPDQSARAGKLFHMFVLTWKKTAQTQLRLVERANGYEAWRVLCLKMEVPMAGRHLSMLQEIINYNMKLTKDGDAIEKLAQFELAIDKYEMQSRQVIDRGLKVGKLLELVPEDMKTQLYMTVTDPSDYDRVKEIFTNVVLGKRNWKTKPGGTEHRTSTEMEIDELWKQIGNGKGGKGGKGKGKDKDGKGGKDSKNRKSSENYRNKDNDRFGKGGKGDANTQNKYGKEGKPKCKHCGRDNHPSSACWFKKEVAALDNPPVIPVGLKPLAAPEINEFYSVPEDGSSWMMAFECSAMSHDSYREILIDSGSEVTACGRDFGEEFGTTASLAPKRFRGIDGSHVPHHGERNCSFEISDYDGLKIPARMHFEVAGIARTVASVGDLMSKGINTHFQDGQGWLDRGGRCIPLIRRGNRFFLRIAWKGDPNALEDPDTVELAAWEDTMLPFNHDDEDDGSAEPAEVNEDEAMVTDGPGEYQAPMPASLATPGEPTAEQRALHNLTHAEFEPWCHHCVSGRAQQDQHRHKTRNAKQPEEECVVQIDYHFYTQELKAGESNTAMVAALTMVDVERGYLASCLCLRKGAQDKYAVKALATFCDDLGSSKIVIQCDQEAALINVAEAAKALRRGHTTIRYAPVASKQSAGYVENANKLIEGQLRTYKSFLEEHYEEKIVLESPILPWMVRHSAWTIANFRTQKDGHTPYYRIHGKEREEVVLQFGESCMARKVHTDSKQEARWIRGIWVGKTSGSREHMVLTKNGAISTRTVRRFPEQLQWQKEIYKEAKGLPWAPRAATNEVDDDKEEKSRPRLLVPGRVMPKNMDGGTVSDTDSSGSEAGSPPGLTTPRADRPSAPQAPNPTASQATATPPATWSPSAEATAMQTAPAAASPLKRAATEDESLPSKRVQVTPADLPPAAEPGNTSASASSAPAANTYVPEGTTDGLWLKVGGGRWKRSPPESATRFEDLHRAHIDGMEEDLGQAFVDPEMLVIPNGADIDKQDLLDARRVEVDRLTYFQTYEWIKDEDAKAMRYIKSRWEDKKTEDPRKAPVRARWVLKDYANDKRPEFYSGTPASVCIKILECFAMENSWAMQSGDVSTAFMHADEKSDIVTDPPDGWQRKGWKWRLLKNINGRRTGAKEWFTFFGEEVKAIGLSQSAAEPCLFFSEKRDFLMVVHVDDILCTGTEEARKHFTAAMQNIMLLKLDDPMVEGTNGIFLGKRKTRAGGSLITKPNGRLIEDILEAMNLLDCTPVSVPGQKSWPPEDRDDEVVNDELHSMYRHVIGKLQYINEERPDIRYVTKELARGLAAPTFLDFRKAKRLGRYLAGTRHLGMAMSKDGAGFSEITCNVDANWANCTVTRKSTSGMVMNIGNKVIQTASKTQSVVAQSSAESELLAIHFGYLESCLAAAILQEITGTRPVVNICTDSSAARSITLKQGLCGIKHMDIKLLRLQDEVRLKRMRCIKIPGTDNCSDILTKEVDNKTMDHLWHQCGMVHCHPVFDGVMRPSLTASPDDDEEKEVAVLASTARKKRLLPNNVSCSAAISATSRRSRWQYAGLTTMVSLSRAMASSDRPHDFKMEDIDNLHVKLGWLTFLVGVLFSLLLCGCAATWWCQRTDEEKLRMSKVELKLCEIKLQEVRQSCGIVLAKQSANHADEIEDFEKSRNEDVISLTQKLFEERGGLICESPIFFTKTGNKYHMESCHYGKGLDRRKLEPCDICMTKANEIKRRCASSG